MSKSNPDIFANAAKNIPKMLREDRHALLRKLPQIAAENPSFALEVADKFRADRDQGIANTLANNIIDIIKANKECGFTIADQIARSPTNISTASHLAKHIGRAGELDLGKAITLAETIDQHSSPDAYVNLGAQLINLMILAKNNRAVQTRAMVIAISIIGTEGNVSAKNIINKIPDLAEHNAALAFELIDQIIALNPKTISLAFLEMEGDSSEKALVRKNETYLQLASQLPALAATDPEKATGLMHELFTYQDPSAKGNSKPYTTLQGEIVERLGSMAKHIGDEAFEFAESLIVEPNHPWKMRLSYAISSFAEVDIKRTLSLTERLCAGNTADDWRYSIEPVIALSDKTGSQRVTKLIETAIEQGDSYVLGKISENLASLRKIPRATRETWADRLYEIASRLRSESADQIMKNVAGDSTRNDGPANDARTAVSLALEHMGIAL